LNTHTHTHTHTDTDTHTHRQTHRHTDTETDTHAHRQTHRHTETDTDTRTHRQTHTINHLTLTLTLTDRHTYTETDTHTHRHRYTDTHGKARPVGQVMFGGSTNRTQPTVTGLAELVSIFTVTHLLLERGMAENFCPSWSWWLLLTRADSAQAWLFLLGCPATAAILT